MDNSKLKILIVEDNEAQGNALLEVCKRNGFAAVLCKTPQEALECLKYNDFRLAIVDLMLPKMNGIDLAERINEITHVDTQFIFISGVFKEKSIAKKAMERVPFLEFFKKPFDLEELMKTINEFAKPYLSESTPPLYQLYYKKRPSKNELIKAINDTKVIHGFDLTWIYAQVIDNNISGKLHVMSSEGTIFTVEFHNGNLTFLNLDDSSTYFGALLIEMGFSNQLEINNALENKKIGKKIGEHLIDQISISPHVVELIKKEQLRIRLSRSISDSSYEVKFEALETPDEPYCISYEELIPQLNQLILSKVSSEWLRTFFTPWHTHQIFKGTNYELIDEVLEQPIMRRFKKIKRIIDADATIEKIISANTKYEGELLKALYLLLNLKVLQLSPKSTAAGSDESQLKRFNKIYKNMEKQNFFEILGISPHAAEKEIAKGYHELAKILHPDKLPTTASPKLRSITEDIFSKITEAYTTLKNAEKKQEYLNLLEIIKAEEYLKNEKLMEEGQKALKNRRYIEAYNYLEVVYNSKYKPSSAGIYYAWALLKKGYTRSTKKTILEEVLSILNQVPTEDRHFADYFYVKGIFYSISGSKEKANRSLRQAISLDPSNISAKREITKLKRRETTSVDFGSKTILFDLDVTEALTAIYRKSKKKTG